MTRLVKHQSADPQGPSEQEASRVETGRPSTCRRDNQAHLLAKLSKVTIFSCPTKLDPSGAVTSSAIRKYTNASVNASIHASPLVVESGDGFRFERHKLTLQLNVRLLGKLVKVRSFSTVTFSQTLSKTNKKGERDVP